MKMMNRTFNTLFMLSSVDGKISTGFSDRRDVDKDFPLIAGLSEGLPQYYALEAQTDLHSFNTGRVMAKVGINEKIKKIKKLPVSFIIVDNTHLTKQGVENLIAKSKKLFIITSNKHHPAFLYKEKAALFYYPKKIDFEDVFKKLKQEQNIKKITIQSGGTLNALLLRKGLIDRISLVFAPALIGGKDTPTIMDGLSLKSKKDLLEIKTLRLRTFEKLKHSYVHVEYDIVKKN